LVHEAFDFGGVVLGVKEYKIFIVQELNFGVQVEEADGDMGTLGD